MYPYFPMKRLSSFFLNQFLRFILIALIIYKHVWKYYKWYES